MTQGRLPTRRELNGLPSWWNHRLTFQAVRQWPCMESFQIIHGISGLFLCEWVYHMYAHMYRMHITCMWTARGLPWVLLLTCFVSVLRQNPSLTWNSKSLLSLPAKHWDLQACTTKPSLFRWVLGSVLGSSCLCGKLFSDWTISRGPEFFFSV